MAPDRDDTEHWHGKMRSRPLASGRKSSFTDTISKITTFSRRRTTTLLPHSASTTNIFPKSRLPTPQGVPRSTSFVSSLNRFASKSSGSHVDGDENDPPAPSKRSRKLSSRLAHTPFFNQQQQAMSTRAPTGSTTLSKNRDSSVKIEQRGLMQPVHPPLPRSSTMGDLLSAQTTTSDLQLTASNSSRSVSRNNRDNTSEIAGPSSPPPVRVVKLQKIPVSYPSRKDSLMPPPARRNPSSDRASATQRTPSEPEIDEATIFRTEPSRISSQQKHVKAMTKSESSFQEEFERSNLSEGERKPRNALTIAISKSSSVAPPRLQEIKVDEKETSPELKGRKTQGTGPDGQYEYTRSSEEISDPRLIHSAQPNNYWMGRYIALSDHSRGAALPLATDPDPQDPSNSSILSTPRSGRNTTRHPSASQVLSRSDHHHPMHDAGRRDKAVFAHLRDLCTTEEARESLAVFRGLMAEALGEVSKRGINGAGDGRGRKSMPVGVREKKGWLEGLIGKRRTSGLKY